jgi:hypothetical protein
MYLDNVERDIERAIQELRSHSGSGQKSSPLLWPLINPHTDGHDLDRCTQQCSAWSLEPTVLTPVLVPTPNVLVVSLWYTSCMPSTENHRTYYSVTNPRATICNKARQRTAVSRQQVQPATDKSTTHMRLSVKWESMPSRDAVHSAASPFHDALADCAASSTVPRSMHAEVRLICCNREIAI